ncbi:MAG: hypothetical protein WBO92_05120 [Candidatus Moraniibacteriota bacterium]
MLSKLPAVCHAGLQHRSPGNLALHLHFDRDLDEEAQGVVLSSLGAYVLQKKGPTFSPDFHGAVVLLRPLKKLPLGQEDFKAVAKHFGYESPDGDLPFLGHGQCPIVEEADDNRPIYVSATPLLKQ